jgi:hypothetical protein
MRARSWSEAGIPGGSAMQQMKLEKGYSVAEKETCSASFPWTRDLSGAIVTSITFLDRSAFRPKWSSRAVSVRTVRIF